MNGRVASRASLAAFLVVLTACASSTHAATDASIGALGRHVAASPPTTTTPPSPPCDPPKTFRPTGVLPSPGAMPVGTPMYDVEQHHLLVAGVDENTQQLSARNPDTKQLEGFEVDLVKEIAFAITGDRNAVQLKSVVTEEKVPFVEQGKVDLTVSAVSITCERWEHVDFSTEYLTTSQRVLVRTDSSIQHLADLARHKVCVTAGSTTFAKLHEKVPDAIKVEVPARTDCLMALQDGRVDAIASHATILYGLQQQDQDNTKVLNDPEDSFSEQHYGIPVARLSNGDTSFVRFVNGVLEQLRTNGTLAALYDRWLTPLPPGTARVPEIDPSTDYRD